MAENEFDTFLNSQNISGGSGWNDKVGSMREVVPNDV